ncbi:MAG: hypothetical protein AAGD10_04360 [Myxococcota bacterium]
MRILFTAVSVATAALVGALAWAGSAHDEAGHPEAPFAFTYDTLGLPIPADASDAERLKIMSEVFAHRVHRIDWASDSVVSRIRWALDDAQASLQSDPVGAKKRLDDAQRLLESW